MWLLLASRLRMPPGGQLPEAAPSEARNLPCSCVMYSPVTLQVHVLLVADLPGLPRGWLNMPNNRLSSQLIGC